MCEVTSPSFQVIACIGHEIRHFKVCVFHRRGKFAIFVLSLSLICKKIDIDSFTGSSGLPEGPSCCTHACDCPEEAFFCSFHRKCIGNSYLHWVTTFVHFVANKWSRKSYRKCLMISYTGWFYPLTRSVNQKSNNLGDGKWKVNTDCNFGCTAAPTIAFLFYYCFTVTDTEGLQQPLGLPNLNYT